MQFNRILFLTVFFSSSLSFSADGDTARIKTMRYMAYSYNVKDTVRMRIDSVQSPGSNSYNEYDDQGNRTLQEIFEEDGSSREVYHYTYNKFQQETGRTKSTGHFKQFGEGKKMYSNSRLVTDEWKSVTNDVYRSYTYNESGHLTEDTELWVTHRFGGTHDSTFRNNTYFYSENGMLLSKKVFENKSLVVTFKYEISADSTLVIESKFDNEDTLVSKSEFSYDPKGLLLVEKHYNNKEELRWRAVYTYDQYDHQLSRILYTRDGSVNSEDITVYEYYPYGHVTVQKWYKNGLPYSCTYRSYTYYK